MNPYDYKKEVIEDSNQVIDDAEQEDSATLTKGQQSLMLTEQYAPNWRPPHAIREFYQNWKDAIIETSHLRQKDFSPIVKGYDSNGAFVVEVYHPETSKLLGFILFKDGVVEFTNFNARLSRRALGMGATTKRANPEAAGTHGEGFKVAALAMVIAGYHVQIQASDYYWNFQFGEKDKSTLCCILNPMTPGKLAKQVAKWVGATNTARPLVNNIWQDVSVKIGKIGGRGLYVQKADFEKWIEVSVDLHRPNETIHTERGTLILDPNFSAKLYLKGLLLESNSSERKFTYGYNFFRGVVNRDRERLSSPLEQSQELAEIWAHAIETNEAKTLGKYVTLLQADDAADVHQVNCFISRIVATKVWRHLRSLDPERRLFYHYVETAFKDVEIIKNSLKKQPHQLPKAMWVSLRKYNLIRTPEEQQIHLLHMAPVSKSIDTPFSLGVKRGLRAALALDQQTKDIKLIFKDGGSTDLDVIFQNSNLEINDKWSDFHKSHLSAPCWLSRQSGQLGSCSETQAFSCDHLISDLYLLAMKEIGRHLILGALGTLRTIGSLHQEVCEKLHQMPVMVSAAPGELYGEIKVSWNDRDGNVMSKMYGVSPHIWITLHRESTCSNRRNDLTTPEVLDLLPQSMSIDSPHEKFTQGCGCWTQMMSHNEHTATFGGMDPAEEYFPMVSRSDSQSFFSLAPQNVRPRATTPITLEPKLVNIIPEPRCEVPNNTLPAASIKKGDTYVSSTNRLSSQSTDISTSIALHNQDDTRVTTNAPGNTCVVRVTPTPLITPRPLGIDIEGQQNELIVVKGMLTEHKRTIRAMDMSMEDLKGKIRTQDLVIAHKNEENQKATTRAVTLQRTLKSSQADATRYLQQSVTDTICLDQTKQKLSTSMQDVIDLQEKLRGRVADEMKVAKQAKDEIALRSEELETLKNEMKLCAANNDNLQAPETIEQLHREIENLNADIRSLTANLEQCEDAYDEQVTLASKTAERRRRMPKRARSSSVSVEDNLYPVEKRLRINS